MDDIIALPEIPIELPKKVSNPFPVVAIGASAGGIEAITTLLEALDPDNGMAYVIIQHLSPNVKSLLPEIFERKTTMPVQTVQDGQLIEKNNVYVIPPNKYISVIDGHLALTPRTAFNKDYHTIDHFFITLAQVYQNRAIGVILSGTLSDGTIGLKAIKAEGGITFAQDDSAKFESMPRNASASGYVDFVLSPKEIAVELGILGRTPYVSSTPAEDLPEYILENDAKLKKVLNILRRKTGVDFSLYKKSTINRRILRRVTLNKIYTIEDYIKILMKSETEANYLYNDLLINVTSFFRDPDFFKALTTIIFPALFNKESSGDIIRIWVTACSTGEEAYSLAISLFEYLEAHVGNTTFQIFATDLNQLVIEKARSGVYHESVLTNISPGRLQKYFTRLDGHYQVIKAIRDVCVFATHNLLSDPPFSKIDILSCQNALIYLGPPAQKKILQTFHYALKPTGYLLLGKSESTGGASNFFEQANKDFKVYTRRAGVEDIHFDFSIKSRSHLISNTGYFENQSVLQGSNFGDVEKETDRILLSRYVPSSLLVNKDMQIVRFNGNTADYLQPAAGKASLHVLKMVKDEFVFELRSLINKVKKEDKSFLKEGIHSGSNGQSIDVTLEVVPVRSLSKELFYLVLFKPRAISFKPDVTNNPANGNKNHITRIHELENELKDVKDQVKGMSEEFEATREEVQSSNEEVLSSNEELQSINEELETSKEEIQSTNEELTTINEELQHRNDELKEAFEYRDAIVETIYEPLLVLNIDLRILSANKAFYSAFHTTAETTEGQYLFEIDNGQWRIDELKNHIEEIISKGKSVINFEIAHNFKRAGQKVLSLTAIKMKNDNKRNNKVLLVIDDITERKKAESGLLKSHQLNLDILNSISDVFMSLDNNWNYTFINKQAEAYLGKTNIELLGKNIWEVTPIYAGTTFQHHLVEAMRTRKFVQFEFFDELSKQWFNYRIYPTENVLSIYSSNITEQKLSIDIVKQSRERYQNFISKSAEGICCYEVHNPISVELDKTTQQEQLLKSAYVAECNNVYAIMHGHQGAENIIGKSMGEMKSKEEVKVMKIFIENGYRLLDVEVHLAEYGVDAYYLKNMVGIIENNEVKRIWVTQRDITDLKTIQRSLHKTQEHLKLALTAGSVATWLWEISSNELEWTTEQSQLYGLQQSPAKRTYQDWLHLIHPDDIAETELKIKNAIINKTDVNIEFRVIWPDSSIHWILLKANIDFDDQDNPIKMAGINIDITDRKLLEKHREDFIGIASHELKTPVTSIKAYTEILVEILTEKNDTDSAILAQKMGVQVDRLTNLIKDLLDVTKITRGQLELRKTEFDICLVIMEVIDDMQATTRSHKITYEMPRSLIAFGDKYKIGEVLVNFISNAIKYSITDERIIIKCIVDNEQVIVSVKDFGIGLSHQFHKEIFERFYRISDDAINTYSGLGLGLFICAEIIKNHSGKIWVNSKKNEGAEFFFSLPLITI